MRPKSAGDGTMACPKCLNHIWFIATRAVSGFFFSTSHCANASRRPVLVAQQQGADEQPGGQQRERGVDRPAVHGFEPFEAQ